MEQLQARFTEHVLAENDVECERTACDSNGGIIPAGQHRYYVYPKPDKNGIAHGPGKWCCKKCYMYYRGQKDTVIRTVPAATAPKSCSTTPSSFGPDVNSIRKSVNESQRQGNFFKNPHPKFNFYTTRFPHALRSCYCHWRIYASATWATQIKFGGSRPECLIAPL